MLLTHKQFLPAFGIEGIEDQRPVCVYTVLSINEQVRDCAAYRGVGPSISEESNPDGYADLMERIRGGGSKIMAAEAEELFSEIELMELRYRR